MYNNTNLCQNTQNNIFQKSDFDLKSFIGKLKKRNKNS